VIHMTFALSMQIPNHIRFGDTYALWAETLPQFLFLWSIFGYLVFCIVYKWCIDWSQSPVSPPSLLNTLIQMFLTPGVIKEGEQLYHGQGPVQMGLLILAGVCVPWMLCSKPYIIWKETKNIKEQGYGQIRNDDEMEREEEGNGTNGTVQEMHEESGDGDDEEHGFGDVVIHQIIHTIEFCLGCISNTASYLRLWALSLAHAQLSEVLWNMTVGNFLPADGIVTIIGLVIASVFWFGLTVGALCIMEGLSAFLHALRLHWVEGNNKHFIGGGTPFTPLSFDNPENQE